MNKRRLYAWMFLGILFLQIITPTATYALTGGPSQPEFSSFTPIGTSDMVNLPSGDFQYNISLLDVGGYPLNLAYHSGATMDEEASVVGLSWSVNSGSINRSIRALPDDFSGDKVTKEFNMKPNVTLGAKANLKLEAFGKDLFKVAQIKMGMSLGMFYNNYKGLGYEFGISPALTGASKSYSGPTASMGLNVNSQGGANFSASANYSTMVKQVDKAGIDLGASIGLSVNSREGLKATTLGISASDNSNVIQSSKNVSVSAFSSSAQFSYGTKTFIPQVQMPMISNSTNFSFTPGGLALFGTNSGSSLTGYLSTQQLLKKSVSNSAYGLLYAEKGSHLTNALMDFNREKDQSYNDYSVNLPLTVSGNDILNVSGQGVGGSYLLKRGDIPMFYDARAVSVSGGNSVGLEIGTGSIFHGGVDISMTNSSSVSKKWTSKNEVLDSYNFRTSGNASFEPSYYKAAGEMGVESDLNYYENLGEEKAVRANLESGSGNFDVKTGKILIDHSGNTVNPSGSTAIRTKRERRSQVISYLTTKEASQVGLEKGIRSYKLNEFTSGNYSIEPRLNSYRKSHHISQIETLRPDGLRYVYGMPAYNISQREVTFNATGRSVDCNTGKLTYQAGDNTINNKLGDDNYFNAVNTPGYAHTYLLTAVLSQDYEDRTGDGLSVDDFGSYTQFNYGKTTANSSYKWRVPFESYSATHNPGLLSNTKDDKASYLYGEKEIWLTHSIESKTMIAEFYYSERGDGYGVQGEDGGIALTNPNKKLDKIILYSKADRNQNGVNAKPIKTVHFEYDYELCPGVPNSKSGGKLTLKEVYFTYGFSKKGKLSSYKFQYNNNTGSYDMKAYDRWGNYKSNDHNASCNLIQPGQTVSNDEMPYSEQDESKADSEAGMWCLKSIKLPSNGLINIEYGAKHYAYIQDKPAMRMFKITGIKEVGKDELYPVLPGQNLNDYLKVYFRLDHPGISRNQLKEQYLRDIKINKDYIFIKAFVKMNVGLIKPEKWEYISLYSQISDYGVEGSNGFLILKPLESEGKDLNPISKYGFQFLREYMPDIAYGENSSTFNDIARNPLNAMAPLASMVRSVQSLVVGFNTEMRVRGNARIIDVHTDIKEGRSLLRLYDPDGKKFGGGALVKKITISDNWGNMTNSGQSFQYGQTYEYATQDAGGNIISSGVVSSEPQLGNEESPFRKPFVVSEERKWAPDNVHYVETPFGESFMPAPQIVFSEIKVKNLEHQNVRRTATGYSVMKYYTAKDFPTLFGNTDLQKMPKRRNPLLSLLKIKMKEHQNVSEGFVVINNNMHGQAKSKAVFDENNTLISKIEYFYKTKPNSSKELDNYAEVLMSDGKVERKLIGVDYQLTGDTRESISKSMTLGASWNTDGFLATILPVLVVVPWPDYNADERQYRAVSMTKLINKVGLLDKVVATDLGSTIATENLLYDGETGEVVVTKTYNEYEDPIFNTKLSAHLAYRGMQGAYQNIGLESRFTLSSPGNFSVTDATPYLPGDELVFYTKQANGSINNVITKGWVLNVNSVSNNLHVIDISGNNLSISGNPLYGKIIRSGHRNMPGASIGTITSRVSPVNNGKLDLTKSLQVLNSGAVEYANQWQTYCDDNFPGKEGKCYPVNGNPFVTNKLGNWKPKKSWLYLTERDRSPLAISSTNTNLRENGFYTNFNSFWNPQNRLWSKNENNWIWTTEVTQFNPNGTELENVDKLGRYSAEITGYYDQLVTGVGSNSRYRQLAFNGFEDYHYNRAILNNVRCEIPRHFGQDIPLNKVSNEAYHTGKYSIRLKGETIETTNAIDNKCDRAKSNLSSIRKNDLKNCDCVQSFSPDPGKYVITAWVREGDGLGQIQYEDHDLRVSTNSSSATFKAKGNIIDGWQRIEGTFEVKPVDTFIKVALTAKDLAYFDDIRIFPFDGDMKNFVYDDISLKLLSEIDANGFANFYEYDGSGELIRVKKETERGIMTIQESRSSQPKL